MMVFININPRKFNKYVKQIELFPIHYLSKESRKVYGKLGEFDYNGIPTFEELPELGPYLN